MPMKLARMALAVAVAATLAAPVTTEAQPATRRCKGYLGESAQVEVVLRHTLLWDQVQIVLLNGEARGGRRVLGHLTNKQSLRVWGIACDGALQVNRLTREG